MANSYGQAQAFIVGPPRIVYPVQKNANQTASNSGTSLVINKPVPAPVQIGDLLIVFISYDAINGHRTFTPPTGWTLLGQRELDSFDHGMIAFWRYADSDPATYTFTVDTDVDMVGQIVCYGNATIARYAFNVASPVIATSTTQSIATTNYNERLITWYAGSIFSTWVGPATEFGDGSASFASYGSSRETFANPTTNIIRTSTPSTAQPTLNLAAIISSDSTLEFAQAQAQIKAVNHGFGQSQAWIEGTSSVYGQAQGIVRAVARSHGQAQAQIKQAYNQNAQAQTSILRTEVDTGQAQGTIKTIYYGFGQAQTTIAGQQTYNVFAQGRAKIKYNYSQIILTTPDLISYWRLGETSGTVVNDIFDSHNGTYVNTPALGEPGAIVNDSDTAVRFDGTDYVTGTNFTLPTQITIEGWVKGTLTANSALWSEWATNGSMIYFTTGSTVRMYVNATFTPSYPVIATDWTYLVGTYDGATLKLYVNTVLVATQPLVGSIATPAVTWNLGTYNNASGTEIAASMDEIALYSRPLTQDEISEHYASGMNLIPGAYGQAQAYIDSRYGIAVRLDSPVVHYRLLETSGTVATNDATPGTGNGTYGSGVTYNEVGPLLPSNNNSPKAIFVDGGANDYLNMGNSEYINTFSLEFWAKSNNNTITAHAEATGSAPGTSGQRYIVYANQKGSNRGLGVSLGTNGVVVYQHGDFTLAPVTTYYANLGTIWHHYVIVQSSGTAKIYVDGLLVRTGLNSFKTVYTPNRLGVGSHGNWAGYIAEPALYTTALDATQVMNHYIAGSFLIPQSFGQAQSKINSFGIVTSGQAQSKINSFGQVSFGQAQAMISRIRYVQSEIVPWVYSTARVITLPNAPTEGNLLIATVGTQGGAGISVDIAGWTLHAHGTDLYNNGNQGGTGPRFVFWKRVVAGDTATVTVTSTGVDTAIAVVEYYGFVNPKPLPASYVDSVGPGGTSSKAYPDETPTTSALIFGVVDIVPNYHPNQPAGWTLREDVEGGTRHTLQVADNIQHTASGATIDGVLTPAGGETAWHLVTFQVIDAPIIVSNGQAQAYIKGIGRGFSQAQAKINSFGQVIFSQAQAYIKGSPLKHSQAQALLGYLPYFASAGVGSYSTGDITPALPVGWRENDIFLLFVESNNELVIAPDGWLETASSYQEGTGVNLSRLTIFWRRATSSESAPTVLDAGIRTSAVINAYRNVRPVGDPWIASSGGSHNGAVSQVFIAGTSTPIHALVVIGVTAGVNGIGNPQLANATNPNLENITQRTEYKPYGVIAVFDGQFTNIGNYGTTTISANPNMSHGTAHPYITLALVNDAPTPPQSEQGQAQASILAKNNKVAQARTTIKTTVNGFGQARASIKAISTQNANAQAFVQTHVINCGQAQASILTKVVVHSQAQANILATSTTFGQTQGHIVTVDVNTTAQAQAFISKSGGYGQAQAYIYNPHFLLSVTVSDRRAITTTVSDRLDDENTVTMSDTRAVTSTVSDRPSFGISVSDRATMTIILSDQQY